MSDRYIRRFALPERLYAASAPVVLAAGVLLEDTRLPRLVAQMKWKSIAPRPLAALTVAVRCPGEDGETVFTYTDLRITRGQTFGVYTAVVLPMSPQRSMEIRALSADFTDGTRWTAPEGAVWAPLPAFDALAGAVEDPELLALSAALPRNRYAFWSGQGLWYCPCGGVNRGEEAACHRCGCSRSEAERLATPEGLRQVRRERTEEAERLAREEAQRREEAQARARERKEAARQRLSGLKARFHRGPAPAETPQEAPEPLTARETREIVPEPLEASGTEPWEASAPADGEAVGTLTPAPEEALEPREETAPVPAAKPRRRGKKALGIAAVVVLLAAAGFFFLSRLLGGTDADIGITEVWVLHVTAPGDGETVLFTVEEDDEGVCTVTPELVREQIPGVEYLNLDGVPDMGDDIDPYLINSFQMAMLVTSRGEYGSENEWGSFDANRDPDSPLCLLLYDSNFHLMGHAVGVPQEAGDGLWQMEVTLCDYDFTALYEQQLSNFEAQQEETFANYIAPEDILDSGAAYFLEGYNTGRGPTLLPGDAQTYHLWAQYTSPYVEQHCREMDRLRDRLPRDDRWRAYLLLDEDYQLLGYTMMDSTGGGGQAANTELTPLGTVELIVEENSDGNCEFTEEKLRQIVPEMDFFNFEGFVPDLSGDVKAYVTDSLHMAWLVASQGRERGGHSSATWNLSADHIFTLLLYRDFTTLCGYFVGAPEDLGGGRWRMEITLCDYNFSALYQEQSVGYTAAPQLPEISQDDIVSCGAVWYIEPVEQLYGEDSFNHRLRLQSLWSRATSPYISRFRHPITDFPNAARWATEEFPHDYLLLDESGQYMGYVTVTDGERVAAMDFSFPSVLSTSNTGTVSLDLTADGEYCPVTLKQIQTLVPQTRRMEFRGVPDLGSLEEHLKVSDQMAFLIAYGGIYGDGQSSGRFSVQGGRAPFRALLLYSDDTTLCGYFIGEPSHVGGDTWRMDITLCDYDFSDLYEQQKREFEQASMPRYISQDQAAKSGAAWCISTGYYFSEDSDFTRTTELYGMWSREQSMGKERFCKSAADLEQLRPSSGDNTRAYVLLLDKNYRSIGYTILTA